MSKDWSPKELAQASEMMEAQSYMGYNEFSQKVANKTSVPQMDGFTSKGVHWYMERAGASYNLFVLTNEDADAYRRVCTGTYEECMTALSNI